MAKATTPDYGPAALVTLTQAGLAITCEITGNDAAVHAVQLKSLDLRGAMREITETLAGQGYEPANRWIKQDGTAGRKFRRAAG